MWNQSSSSSFARIGERTKKFGDSWEQSSGSSSFGPPNPLWRKLLWYYLCERGPRGDTQRYYQGIYEVGAHISKLLELHYVCGSKYVIESTCSNCLLLFSTRAIFFSIFSYFYHILCKWPDLTHIEDKVSYEAVSILVQRLGRYIRQAERRWVYNV